MEAQVWTLIGLLGASVLGSYAYLGHKIDSLGGRVDGLSTRMDILTARVEDQGRELADRFYEVATKLDDHLRRHVI